MVTANVLCLLLLALGLSAGELITNGGFESLEHWDVSGRHCQLTTDAHSGQHAVQVHGITGPAQPMNVTSGDSYHVSAWVKVITNYKGQHVNVEVSFHYADGHTDYWTRGYHNNATSAEGWVHLQSSFTVKRNDLTAAHIYFQSGPMATVDFLVDDVSVTRMPGGGHVTTTSLNQMIDKLRKSDIHLHVTMAAGINKDDLKIHVLQTKKSFPFGTAVNVWKYKENAGGGRYRDFVFKHFNWAVPENALKWGPIETTRGHKNYNSALYLINELRSHGLKVRGHNLVWSVPKRVPDWVRQLSGNELRTVVKQHIEETLNMTRGLLEHWDVNNENLHGTWYQDTLHDPNYDLELFNITHHADPNVKLFLNDFSVVSPGWNTNDYLLQAQRVKAANVGLYGMGAQCHFGWEAPPDPTTITHRLDLLSQAGIPIWVTELDVYAADENERADWYEEALRAVYAHPAVEGILIWGFWDQAHWRGEKAALVKGDNLELTAAGHRVIDLYENQWMTDVTFTLSQSGNDLTVRGFHGDYKVKVIYQGKELNNLTQTFTLGKETHSLNIDVL